MENNILEINTNLVKKIIANIEEDISNEEIIALLLKHKVSQSAKEKYTFGQKASDKITNFTGSWKFVGFFTFSIVTWIILNSWFFSNAFDCFPYVFLNLVLSCVAAIQAPLIMMSQKRQEQKDRQRSQNDYCIDFKASILIKDIYKKIEKIQEKIENT